MSLFEKSDVYSTSNEQQRVDVTLFLKKHLHEFSSKNDVILDIGCGDGGITKDIVAPTFTNYKQIIGVDISKSMLAYANKTYSTDKISFRELNIETKDLPKEYEGKFDKIVSFYCLMWIQNQKAALANIYKMLKNDGEIFLLFPAKHLKFYALFSSIFKSKYIKYALMELESFLPPFYHVNDLEGWYQKMLDEQGFKTIHCDVVPRTYTYTPTQLVDMISSSAPFTIPVELTEEYRQFIFEKAKELGMIVSTGDACAPEDYAIYLIMARK